MSKTPKNVIAMSSFNPVIARSESDVATSAFLYCHCQERKP
jgi:hypothetical protein